MNNRECVIVRAQEEANNAAYTMANVANVWRMEDGDTITVTSRVVTGRRPVTITATIGPRPMETEPDDD